MLTYDDGYMEHQKNAVPVLDSLGLKATFYLSASYPAVAKHIKEWRRIAANGHELGNHTLFHPCMANIPGREWVPPAYDMSQYSMERMLGEIRMTNTFLEAVDGKTTRTFAFTCGDMQIGGVPFIGNLKNDFIAARAVRNELQSIDSIDLYNVACYMVNGESAAQMVEWVQQAERTNTLLVILFHGVGGGNGLNVSLPDHRKFLEYLKQHQKDIWVAPMVEVAEKIKGARK